MENRSIAVGKFYRSLAAFVVVATSVTFLAPDIAEAGSAKITICHRTRSVTNPYRRITVSQNSINRNNGHGDHTGGVFNTTAGWYTTQGNPKDWGDIIPGGDSDGTPYNGSNSIDHNWTAAGKAIFLPTGAHAAKCNRMTAKQFYDIQVAAGVPAGDVITELNEMQANEDAALLQSLGGPFSASNLSTWATAVAVTTNAATSVTDGTGSDGYADLNGSLKFTNGQVIRYYFELSTSSSFTSLIKTSETRTYDTVGSLPFSLTGNGSVQNVPAVRVTGLTQNTYYFRLVGISGYATDTEGVLYGETKSFSIRLPIITTETLPDGLVDDGTPASVYSATLNATGGTGEKTNFRLSTGSLPSGLTITNPGTPNSTASIGGTPALGTQGLYTLPFVTTDSASNNSAVKELLLRIKSAQVVTVPTPTSKAYGDPTFNIGATSNVTADELGDLGSFTSYTGTAGVCSVSSTGVVTILGAGSCTVTANHSGNGFWLSGTGSVTFTIAQRAITLKADNLSKVVNGTNPTPTVGLVSGTLVGSDAVSSATYDFGGSATIPNTAGSYVITPSAAVFSPGNAANYNIVYQTGTLTVSATASAQTIDFPDPADKTWGDPAFSINATSKDGSSNTNLQVAFTSNTPLVCTVGTASKTNGVSSVTVTIVKAGTCTIETTQTGGSNGSATYTAATPVSQSIVISPRPITLKAEDKSKIVDGANPTFSYVITVGTLAGSDAISSLTYTHSSSSYTASTTVPNVAGSFTITPSAAVFSSGLVANYAITYLTGTLTVSAAAVVAATSKTPTDPRKTTDDPFANVSVEPKQNKTKTGGTLTLDGDPPMEVLGATSSDPNIEVEVTKSGVEYNKPQTWVDQGFGDECWKIEPGGSAYVLPATPANPSGRAGLYSLVKVKAGSNTSTDPNFQVNTLFVDPKGGDQVWPDSNKNGIYDAGGKNGDKDISHVILCVRFTNASGATSTTAPSSSTSSTTSSTTSTTSTTVAGGSQNTTPGGSTSGTTTPASSSPTTTLPKDAPDDDGDDDNIIIRVRTVDPTVVVPKTVNITLRLTTGFEHKTVVLAVAPASFEVKKVSSLSTDEAVRVYSAELKLAKSTSSLPATGSESSGLVAFAMWLVALGAAVQVVGRGLNRRRVRR